MFGFCITHILNTGCAEIWKKKSVAKRLILGKKQPKFDASAKLSSVAQHCHNIPLKPHQKINSISQYLTPDFLYVLIEDALSAAHLKSIDDSVYQVFKNMSSSQPIFMPQRETVI